MKDIFTILGFIIVCAVVGFLLDGCVPPTPTDAAKLAAEGAYTDQIVRCAREAVSKAASRACRDKVDAQWGVKPEDK